MKRTTVLAQLAVFGVISVLIVAYTLFDLIGVHLTNRPFTVHLALKTGGGIFDGAEVAFRGVEVGRVTKIDLGRNGVKVTLAIDHGTKVPADSVAHIFDLSAVGEQYVDLVPPATTSTTAYLHAGSSIGEDQTTTPLQTATVLYDLEQFVDSINPADVRTIGTEGAAAFAGVGPDLRSLITDTTQIADELTASKSAAFDLLKNAETLLDGAAAHTAQFDTFATSLKELSHTLAGSTPTLDKFFAQGESTTRLINNLVTANGSAIGVLLANGASLSQIQVAQLPGLAALLVAVPQFGALAPTVIHNGALSGAADINLTQPVCPTGLPLSNPISGKRSALITAGCNSGILVRGANNAPLGSGTSGQSSSAVQIQPSATTTPNGSAQVGSYDASSGLVTESDGTVVRLGTTGGQSEYLGDKSWEALLYAGTGS
jgi:phospholipid/cholesterol/gamma-HCH transport system substrate-binding protein